MLNRREYRKHVFSAIGKLLALMVPLIVFGFYLLVQKATYGWYFYPEHIRFITGFGTGKVQLEMYLNQLFILHGQYILVFLLIASLVFSIFQKESSIQGDRRAISLMMVFFAVYLLFSAFNFFSPRYLLSVTWILAVLCGYFLYTAFGKRMIPALIFSLAVAGALYHYAVTVRNNGDYDLGYVDAVSLQQQTVSFCEASGWYDTPLYCNFLMRENLIKKPAGFLAGKPFSNILTSADDPTSQFLIFNNIENDNAYGMVAGNEQFTLLKRFEKGWMWVEIYARNPSETSGQATRTGNR